MNDLIFDVKSFEELTNLEVYEMLKLRAEVFVVEQNCVYLDIDGKDQIALHIFGKQGKNIVAYARIFPPKVSFKEAVIGRVLVHSDFRKQKIGHDLIKFAVEYLNNNFDLTQIRMSAQSHLQSFYGEHGFKKIGEEYLEDDIPHVQMIRSCP